MDFESDDWKRRGMCVDLDPGEADQIFFSGRGRTGVAARAICSRGAVQEPCLEYAPAEHEDFSIWGGTSERERRKLREASAPSPEFELALRSPFGA